MTSKFVNGIAIETALGPPLNMEQGISKNTLIYL